VAGTVIQDGVGAEVRELGYEERASRAIDATLSCGAVYIRAGKYTCTIRVLHFAGQRL